MTFNPRGLSLAQIHQLAARFEVAPLDEAARLFDQGNYALTGHSSDLRSSVEAVSYGWTGPASSAATSTVLATSSQAQAAASAATTSSSIFASFSSIMADATAQIAAIEVIDTSHAAAVEKAGGPAATMLFPDRVSQNMLDAQIQAEKNRQLAITHLTNLNEAAEAVAEAMKGSFPTIVSIGRIKDPDLPATLGIADIAGASPTHARAVIAPLPARTGSTGGLAASVSTRPGAAAGSAASTIAAFADRTTAAAVTASMDRADGSHASVASPTTNGAAGSSPSAGTAGAGGSTGFGAAAGSGWAAGEWESADGRSTSGRATDRHYPSPSESDIDDGWRGRGATASSPWSSNWDPQVAPLDDDGSFPRYETGSSAPSPNLAPRGNQFDSPDDDGPYRRYGGGASGYGAVDERPLPDVRSMPTISAGDRYPTPGRLGGRRRDGDDEYELRPRPTYLIEMEDVWGDTRLAAPQSIG